VLEALRVGQGTTGYSTGNLYATVDRRLDRVRSKFDKETLKIVADSRSAAIDRIESLIAEHAIACDFRRVPFFHIAETADGEKALKDEFAACTEAGLRVSLGGPQGVPLPFPVHSALRLEGQAQLNPLAYTCALAGATAAAGCRIHEGTKAISVDEEDGQCIVTTESGHTVRARHVLMATHSPKGIMFVQTLLGPYREYALAATLASGTYPPPGTFWTMTGEQRHSLRHYRNEAGEDFLLCLGEPHKVGQKPDDAESNVELFTRLETYLRERFDVASIAYRWGAQHYRSADGLPYIGPRDDDSHVHIATGFATDGLVYGTLAAMLVTDHIVGRDNPWAHAYRFGRRTPIKSAAAWIKENANVAWQYLKDLPSNVDADHFADIGPGEGKTILVDGSKCAAFRDDNGALSVVSAVCTHMACIVAFNPGERTWDCPCHGSRFRTDGTVIEGPAINDLPSISVSIVAEQIAKEGEKENT